MRAELRREGLGFGHCRRRDRDEPHVRQAGEGASVGRAGEAGADDADPNTHGAHRLGPLTPEPLVRSGKRADRQDAADAFAGGSNGPLHAATTVSIAIAVAAVAAWWIVAGLVFYRRSRDLLGLYFSLAFFFFGPCLTDPNLFTVVARQDTIAFVPGLMLLANSLTLPWLYVFPDGKIIPRWGSAIIAFWIGWYVLRVFVPEADPDGLWLLPWAAVPIIGVGTLVFRALRRSDAVQREQPRPQPRA